jgi:hypothetical protein
MTLERFASWLGVAPRTVSYWRSRPHSIPGTSTQEILDAAYERLSPTARDRFAQLAADYIAATPASVSRPPAVRVMDLDQSFPPASDIAAMQGFRAADQKVGGGHLYATVVSYLHTQVAPRLFGVGGDSDGRGLYTAAAGLTEMAGWMAHDAGRDKVARQHFSRALDLAKIGGDIQLTAHVFASMSHLAHHLGEPEQAIEHATAGRLALDGRPQLPELEARLLAMQARGHAVLGHVEDCTELLRQAEARLGRPAEEAPSPWVSGFDEGAFANETARCLHIVGDLSEAERQAQRIIDLRPSERTRSRAIGQILLAGVLVAQGRPDAACAAVRQVLDSIKSLSSGFVISQLLQLRRTLEPHRGSRTVAEFLECLDAELEGRMWLYHWLSKEQDGVVS